MPRTCLFTPQWNASNDAKYCGKINNLGGEPWRQADQPPAEKNLFSELKK